MGRFSLILGLCVAMAPGLAGAQHISGMLAKSGMSPEDFNMMGEAAQTLYVDQPPTTGANTSWENPKSGSYGTVQLVDVSGNCVTILHRVHPKGEDQARQVRNRRCQGDDGQWLNVAE